MTSLDMGLALFVVLGALFGLASGAFRQVLQLVSWAAGMAAPYYLAAPTAKALEGPMQLPYAVVYAFSGLALAILAWVAARIAISAIFRPKSDPNEASAGNLVNRALGALIGTAKAVVLAWGAVSLLVLFAAPLKARGMELSWASGQFMGAAKNHNLVTMLFHERIEQVRQGLERAKRKAPAKGEALAEWFEDSRVKALLDDAKARAALEKGDLAAAFESNALTELLSDHGAIQKLQGALAGGP